MKEESSKSRKTHKKKKPGNQQKVKKNQDSIDRGFWKGAEERKKENSSEGGKNS